MLDPNGRVNQKQRSTRRDVEDRVGDAVRPPKLCRDHAEPPCQYPVEDVREKRQEEHREEKPARRVESSERDEDRGAGNAQGDKRVGRSPTSGKAANRFSLASVATVS